MTTTALEQLEILPRSMAERIAPLFDHPTRERYGRFLNAMYHYTLPSGDQLHEAATVVPADDLREMFEEMSREETSHYKLAEADLAGLGYPLSGIEPPAVIEFNAWWKSIRPERAFMFLGAMYVLENVAHVLRESAARVLADLGATKDQTRFITVHLVADEEHGALLKRFAERYLPDHAVDILAGAKRASDLWVKIHLDTL